MEKSRGLQQRQSITRSPGCSYYVNRLPIYGLKYLFGERDIIAKPLEGSLGAGIFKFNLKKFFGDNEYGKEYDEFIRNCVSNKMLFEECLSNCEDLSIFNKSSLNTIRVVTIRDKGEIKVLGAFIRVGRDGAIVDNAHNGGLFSHIDVATGEVDSSAITTEGMEFERHPDSNVKILGFKIPKWPEIIETLTRAMELCPDVKVCGWDVSLPSNGHIEIIEGNHAPDIDIMQSTIKVGLKREIERIYNMKAI